jgi:alpha-1,2-mannosyltransferase
MGGMRLRFFDLRIYDLGALRFLHGTSLYGSPIVDHLGFTYPPFAALLLAPLGWVPWSVDKLAVTGLNILLLVWSVRRALLLAGPEASDRELVVAFSPGRAWSRAAGIAAAALWLEPINVALGYGQTDLLIMALVVFDLSRADQARTKGVAIGVAAAVKLTPLLFIAYLLFSWRRRAAGVAALSFIASIAVSFLAAPRDASAYWFHKIFQTARIGNPMTPMNQSLHGAIVRLTGTFHPAGGWELLVVVVAVGGLALAVRASRHGDEAYGFSLAALSALLASPISWSHHWTLAVPALVLLVRRAYTQRSHLLVATAVILGLVGYAYLPEIAESNFGATRGAASLLCTDPYPLAAVLVLFVCAVLLARSRVRRPACQPAFETRHASRRRSAARDLVHGLRRWGINT